MGARLPQFGCSSGKHLGTLTNDSGLPAVSGPASHRTMPPGRGHLTSGLRSGQMTCGR